jgi:O-antigen/teichoic acid export membrane protein
MRTENSKKNLLSSISITLLMTLLGFFTRKVFVDNIGIEYLGLNGLLTNILSVVALLEGGFGTSIVYHLNNPLAEGDRPRIIALVQLYRRVYRFIAAGVLVMGLALYPFLDVFIKEGEGLRYVSVVFFIFLFNSLLPYFSAHKWSLISADQKQWRLTGINLVYQVGVSVAKLAILWFTRNYILYLVVEAIFALGLCVAVTRKANRLYPWIVTQVKHRVDEPTRKAIVRNCGALFLHSLGGYMAHSTDNIIISSMVSISMVGLYSNYTMISGYVNSLMAQALNSFSESVGNLIASESAERVYNVFKTIFLVNFIVISIPVIVLANVITPFVAWWLGSEYILGTATVAVILVNLFIFGMRASALTFKIKSGIFVQDRFSPLIQGAINLVLSLWWVRIWGITGVLAATTVSVLAIGFWQYPRLIYKYTFSQPLGRYFAKYALYTALALVALVVSRWICGFFAPEGLWSITGRGFVSIIIPAGIYWLALRRSEEMKRLTGDYLRPAVAKIFRR